MYLKYDYNRAREFDWPWFYVRIEKPGPRGGKRPALIEGRLRAADYDAAVTAVQDQFLQSTKTTVTNG